MHLAELIRDLGVILGIAAVVSLIFYRIRQPVVLGYICAGIFAAAVAGPFTAEFRTLADLGVIFLMFSLGLEFSFRKVVRLGPAVALAALLEVSGLFGLGFLVGRILGWSSQNSIFLGGMLSISSTTIIVKAFDEFGLKSRRFAQLVFGLLVFEDLVAILMLVLFGGMATGNGISSASLAGSLGELMLFMGGWFLAGTFLLPRILKRVAASKSDEMLLVFSVGLCLALGIASAQLGYSAALGAFLMGSILSESSESHRIEDLVRPLKDLFAAIFFVSVGMLIDPSVLVTKWREILLLSAVVIGGKFVFPMAGMVIIGRPLKTAVLVGGSMVQIGEFSFIMAALGVSTGILAPEVHPIIVAVSVLTTLITPIAIRLAPKLVHPIERLLPRRIRLVIEQYSSWSERLSASRQPDPMLRAAAVRWALSGFVVALVSRLAVRFANPWTGAAVGVLLLPFLWAFLRGVTLPADRTLEVRSQVLRAASQAVALLTSSALTWPYFRGTPIIWGVAVLTAILLIRLVGSVGRVFHWFEDSFLATMNSGREKSGRAKAVLRRFAPWEGQLVRLKIDPDSEISGKTIEEASLRNRFGLNIVAIQRGSRLMVAPLPRYQLFPKDEILVLGGEDQIELARRVVERGNGRDRPEGELTIDSYQLRAIEVGESSPCSGKTLRESGIRDRFSALVVGVERDGNRILNPDSSLRVMPGDTLWLVGETDRLAALAEENSRAAHVSGA